MEAGLASSQQSRHPVEESANLIHDAETKTAEGTTLSLSSLGAFLSERI